MFAPLHPSRAERGEEMPFELFLKYTASKNTRPTIAVQ
jgi:hypothetical protein